MRSRPFFATLVVALVAAAAAAQGPLQQKAHYTINVAHELVVGGYALPAGSYELYQVNVTDPSLFALYERGMRHSPLALVKTTRVEAREGDAAPAGDAAVRLDFDETTAEATPVLRGWTIPGQDGYEITAVDGKDSKLRKLK